MNARFKHSKPYLGRSSVILHNIGVRPWRGDRDVRYRRGVNPQQLGARRIQPCGDVVHVCRVLLQRQPLRVVGDVVESEVERDDLPSRGLPAEPNV